MRLAISLSVWLAGTSAVLLGGHGWLQLRTERTDLHAAARRELTLLGTAVRHGVENAIRDGQQPDVVGLLDQLELRAPNVDIFVFDNAGTLLTSSRGGEQNVERARGLAIESATSDALRIDETNEQELLVTAALRIRGVPLGYMVILQPTRRLRADIAAERRAVLLSIASLIVALSLVIWVVVHVRLHRPLSRIVAGVRQVASDDLSVRMNLTGNDEVAELAREFDAMTDRLERARQQLAQETEAREQVEADIQRFNRMVMVGELAATLAHEIGSPLQVLNGRARALTLRRDLPSDATRSAEILVEQTERVIQIVERLLDVARRKAPAFEDLDIRRSVQQVIELVSIKARRLGVSLEVELGETPQVRADPSQIQQVVLNLLQNALRASARGNAVRVAVHSSAFELPAGGRQRPSVAISVEDAGPGIDEQDRARIFEPFFTRWRGDSTPAGTGLGLSVVKSIVADHGGMVTVEPAPNTGARFVVHLPVRAAADEQARA